MKRTRTPFVVTAILIMGTTQVIAGGLLNLPPGTVTVTHGPWNAGATSTIDIKLKSVPEGAPPGYHVWDKTFAGWCLEDNFQPDSPPGSLLTPLDSTDSDPLSCSPGDYAGIPWDQVNYLLNHRQGTAGDIPATIEDVQVALWMVAGTYWHGTFTVTPEVSDLVTDVQLNGPGFTPSGDDIVAVILCADGLGPDPYQDTIVEVILSKTTHVFADGFEGGNTGRWSSVSP